MTDQLIKIGEAGGPDLLYRLQGHTPSYTSWAYDVFDADPMNIQVPPPPLSTAARRLARCLAASPAPPGSFIALQSSLTGCGTAGLV